MHRVKKYSRSLEYFCFICLKQIYELYTVNVFLTMHFQKTLDWSMTFRPQSFSLIGSPNIVRLCPVADAILYKNRIEFEFSATQI